MMPTVTDYQTGAELALATERMAHKTTTWGPAEGGGAVDPVEVEAADPDEVVVF
jgi:hypothetical protein